MPQLKSITIGDAYLRYKKLHPKGTKHFLDAKTYKSICYAFNKKIVNFVLLESGEFRIPHRIGIIRIKKRKTDMNNLRLDYQATKKYGKKIYHLNEHSKEYYYRWFWHKKMAIVKNKSAYCFKPTRANKQYLTRLIKDKNSKVDYPE